VHPLRRGQQVGEPVLRLVEGITVTEWKKKPILLQAEVVREIIRMLKEELYEQGHKNPKIAEILEKAADKFDELDPEWFVEHLQDKFGEEEEQ
jgi:hypothetical protein